MFQLTFLGTSSGVPTKYRNVSGLAVSLSNNINQQKGSPWILIDCGEGTQHQILQTKLSLIQLKAICITHVHGDHCYGLAGLLASCAMSRRRQPLTIIAPKAIGKLLDTLTITTELYFSFEIQFLAIEYILQDSRQGKVCLSLSEQHYVDIDITPLSHRIASYAFGLSQWTNYKQLDTQKLIQMGLSPSPIWGELKRGYNVTLADGRYLLAKDFVYKEKKHIRVVVAGDNDTPELLTKAVENAQLLVHEATYTQAVLDKVQNSPNGFNPQHSTARQVAKFMAKAGLPNLILTHFSARYQPFDKPSSKIANMGHIRTEIEQVFAECDYQGQFWLAKDFEQYWVGSEGVKKL